MFLSLVCYVHKSESIRVKSRQTTGGRSPVRSIPPPAAQGGRWLIQGEFNLESAFSIFTLLHNIRSEEEVSWKMFFWKRNNDGTFPQSVGPVNRNVSSPLVRWKNESALKVLFVRDVKLLNAHPKKLLSGGFLILKGRDLKVINSLTENSLIYDSFFGSLFNSFGSSLCHATQFKSDSNLSILIIVNSV